VSVRKKVTIRKGVTLFVLLIFRGRICVINFHCVYNNYLRWEIAGDGRYK
jgi:hypothetical protein